jgi:hypothetical protein
MLFKISVRTSKRTPHFTITTINWIILCKEIITIYSENHTKPINIKCSITDCLSRWFIYLLLGLKGLTISNAAFCIYGFRMVLSVNRRENVTYFPMHLAKTAVVVTIHKRTNSWVIFVFDVTRCRRDVSIATWLYCCVAKLWLYWTVFFSIVTRVLVRTTIFKTVIVSVVIICLFWSSYAVQCWWLSLIIVVGTLCIVVLECNVTREIVKLL